MTNEIVIDAPPEKIFRTVSNLGNWPMILPHYRWVQPLPDGSVKMGARRGSIPVRWTSRFKADAAQKELYFEHLKHFTRGMKVRWRIVPIGESQSRVTIDHDLTEVEKRYGRFFAERVVGVFFVNYVAQRTLAAFKRHLEKS